MIIEGTWKRKHQSGPTGLERLFRRPPQRFSGPQPQSRKYPGSELELGRERQTPLSFRRAKTRLVGPGRSHTAPTVFPAQRFRAKEGPKVPTRRSQPRLLRHGANRRKTGRLERMAYFRGRWFGKAGGFPRCCPAGPRPALPPPGRPGFFFRPFSGPNFRLGWAAPGWKLFFPVQGIIQLKAWPLA